MKIQYSKLISDLYGSLLPAGILKIQTEETKATCARCIQVPHYDAGLKCCTYHPFLPNYLVGQILKDEKNKPTFITEVMKHKISKRIYVLPLGIVAPIQFQVELHRNKEKKFGKARDWLCPYYDQAHNQCGIWQNRGSVCSSFYCESSKDKPGLHFWEKSLNYLSALEMALAEEALGHLDFSPKLVSEQLQFFNRKSMTAAERSMKVLSKPVFNKLWNGVDDVEAFYVKTLHIVRGFSRKQVSGLLGQHGEKLKQEFIQAGSLWKS